MRILIALSIWLAVWPAYAESMYVTERLGVPLRAAFAEGSPVVKTADVGTTLEVLERADKYARVRDPQGAEGWIEARLLTATPPARPQLERIQAEFSRLQKEHVDPQARIKQLEATLAQESMRGAERARAAEQARSQPASAAPASDEGDADFSWGWLVLAFAMLWIGFGAGVVWVRERHRKRLGGMYLRI